MQPHFRDKLMSGVTQFNSDVDDYLADYNEVSMCEIVQQTIS